MNWKKHSNIWLAVCLLVMTLAVPAGAVTHYVFEGQSIQAAIDDPCTVNGDEIEVPPGTYNEAINFNGKAVRLYSSGGPEVTIIHANGAYHAVQCVNSEDANTILEGFTITGGDASGTYPDDCGGGMYNTSSSPTIINCTFSGNSAQYSGGMFNEGGSPTVTNCTFSGNSAQYGGGMFNSYGGSPTVTNCTFSGNSATVLGGGMHNHDYSSPTVTNCIFTGNSAYYGGGMYNYEYSSPTVTNCNFTGNTVNSGGGMYNSGGNPTVTDCNFSSNSADYAGGGMCNEQSSPMVTNCIFSDNSATSDGGGMCNYSSSPTVTNCTFSGNSAPSGGGMYCYSSISSPTVTNCIFWGDTPNEIYNQGGTPTVTYSDVEGGWGDPCDNNINADPLFVDAAGGDLRLSSDASPCVDAGDNSAANLPTTDLAGNRRVVDGDRDDTAVVDMGAYEFQPGQIHNINKDRWYETIQVAIDDADYGDEIEVGPGTYYEAINFNGRAVRLYSIGGPEVTTINGNGAYHVVQCISGEDANTILDGFTITGGDANGTTVADKTGGGMYNYQSSPTVTNCIFTGNFAALRGGGMWNFYNSSPSVTNCRFVANTTECDGGGVYNEQSIPTLTNCAFSSNSTKYCGGGMYNYNNSSPLVINCTFYNNLAYYNGSGMFNRSASNPAVKNCIFWNDFKEEINNDAATPIVTYCDVMGGTGQPWFGTGCIDTDPRFVGGGANDFRLRPDSPCIDAGNNTAVPSSVLKDLAGKIRFADDPCTSDTGDAETNGRPVVDMGAYEFQGCGAIPQNLLANPGFETGDATGWMSNWGLAADTNQVHEGNYSGLASGRAATWDGAWQSVLGLMDDGKTYRISGWVRLQNADSNYVQLTVKQTDSAGDHYYGIDSATAYRDRWVNLDGTLNFDANESMTDLYIYFEGPAADVNFYVDDASVTEVTGDLNHNGGVDFFDFSLFASYYGFDCSTQDCGLANLYDCDKAINERDLAILVRDWLVGAEP